MCISAHLEGTRALVTVSARPETIHDFSGFSKALLVAAGAGTTPSGSARRLHTHFEYGVLSLAAYRWD